MRQKNTKICEKHGIEISAVNYGTASIPLWHPGSCTECSKESEIKMKAEEQKRQVDAIQIKTKRVLSGEFMGIPKRFREANIRDFEQRYEYTIDDSLLITGGCGTGKTHLAVALAKVVNLDNEIKDPMFVNFQELSIKIKSSFREETESMKEIINPCLRGFRIFDDIGTNKPTETAIEALYTIVNKRYEDVLPTIYTTNLSLAEISSVYGDRIASRLSACEQIKLTGKDKRMEMK